MILGKDESRTILLAPLEESMEISMPDQYRTLAESEDGHAIDLQSIPTIAISDSMTALVQHRNRNPSLPELSH